MAELRERLRTQIGAEAAQRTSLPPQRRSSVILCKKRRPATRRATGLWLGCDAGVYRSVQAPPLAELSTAARTKRMPATPSSTPGCAS
jgi:hypothetical protein